MICFCLGFLKTEFNRPSVRHQTVSQELTNIRLVILA